MGPGEGWVPPKADPERERLTARRDAAERRGWKFRYDMERLEFFAARELKTARTLEDLLELVEDSEALGEAAQWP